MKVVGLIVEYNPLHNGHSFHFSKSKEVTGADATVIVMSGHFLQRGEPALVNKWARAKMALNMGVDLVIELPYVYATQQAQHFAFGAVSILNHLPFVTHLCFGSESGNIQTFIDVARILSNEPSLFRTIIQREMKSGNSYPHAYAQALNAISKEYSFDPNVFSKPNNILGLHYVMSLFQLQSDIVPLTIKREKADYHDIDFHDQAIASATSIRRALFADQQPQWENIRSYVPPYTYEVLMEEATNHRGPVNWEHFYRYLVQSIIAHPEEALAQLYEIEEGIEYRFKSNILQAESIQHLCELIKTKRYTWNRIQRMLVHILHQFTSCDAAKLSLDKGPTYLRLLGYSNKGRELLNRYKKEMTIPLISNVKKDRPDMLEWDVKAATMYTLGYTKDSMTEKRREFWQPPLHYTP